MLLKFKIVVLLSSLILPGCANSIGTDNVDVEPDEEMEQSIVDSTKYSSEEDFYGSIIEITLKHEESIKLKEYGPQDFKRVNFSFVSNYQTRRVKEVDDDYRTTLVAVLSKPSKENVIKTIEALASRKIVYDAKPVYITYLEDEYYDKQHNLDKCYDTLFNKTNDKDWYLENSRIDSKYIYENYDDGYHWYKNEDFQEIEIDKSKPFRCSYIDDWNIKDIDLYSMIIQFQLIDKSLINTKESFLELRNNPIVRWVSGFTGGIPA